MRQLFPYGWFFAKGNHGQQAITRPFPWPRSRIGETVRACRMPRADGHILSSQDRRALKTLGLGEDADRRALRSAYSAKVRNYHPDKNGGNRSYEKALQDVIAAYTHLKSSPAFT